MHKGRPVHPEPRCSLPVQGVTAGTRRLSIWAWTEPPGTSSLSWWYYEGGKRSPNGLQIVRGRAGGEVISSDFLSLPTQSVV